MKIKNIFSHRILITILESYSIKNIILILFILLLLPSNLNVSKIIDLFKTNIQNNTKNILFISPSLGNGGAERITCRLASEFSKKYNVYLIFFIHIAKEYFISPNVKLVELPKDYLNSENKIFRFIENAIVKYKIDVLINFLRWYSKFDLNIRKGTKFIFSERADPSKRNCSKYKVMMSTYEKADIIVFQTNYVKNQFKENIKKKGVIIQNPIQIECLSNQNTNSKKIVTVGRITSQKNQVLLIEAFSIFKKSHKGYELYIYGIGDLLHILKKIVKKKELKNSIHFEGFSRHIHKKIKDAEIFVLSSDFEGQPNALMEAMMMGIPSISTNCSGISEIITDEENGLLVPVGNVSSLANAIARLSDNETLRNKIRKGAIRKSYEWKTERIVKKWEEILF